MSIFLQRNSTTFKLIADFHGSCCHVKNSSAPWCIGKKRRKNDHPTQPVESGALRWWTAWMWHQDIKNFRDLARGHVYTKGEKIDGNHWALSIAPEGNATITWRLFFLEPRKEKAVDFFYSGMSSFSCSFQSSEKSVSLCSKNILITSLNVENSQRHLFLPFVKEQGSCGIWPSWIKHVFRISSSLKSVALRTAIVYSYTHRCVSQ